MKLTKIVKENFGDFIYRTCIVLWKRVFILGRSFQNEEFYICIHSLRGIDEVLFTTEGGVEIGDVEAKAKILKIGVAADGVSDQEIKDALLDQVPDARKE